MSNLHTEEAAREKWCFATASAGPLSDKCRCVASECMAWQWAGHQVETEINNAWSISNPPEGWRYIVSYNDGQSKFARALSNAKKVGYCALTSQGGKHG